MRRQDDERYTWDKRYQGKTFYLRDKLENDEEQEEERTHLQEKKRRENMTLIEFAFVAISSLKSK